jgi:aminopeptidase N
MSSSNLQRWSVLAGLAVVILLAGCQRHTGSPDAIGSPANSPRPIADALDRHTADLRKERIANLEYELFIDVQSVDEEFLGTTRILFDLADASSDLTIDFVGGNIGEIRVNDKTIETNYNGFFVTVPSAALREGSNAVDIRYRHPYDKDGTGLHRFVDPQDGLTYLYSYLWPYYANRLFPSFDQPNLKGNFSLTVLAPKSWTVVSTTTGIPETADDESRLWRFATTPKMSTYVFSLHAGPYKIWENQAGEVPLRLMARQSLAEFVAVDEWFDVTRRGLAHYGQYFDIPYAFEKYDQLIVPDFAIGAMENIAAVTFSENYVQRQPSDRSERERRASVILHEMAHMWFGNLVTHEWWNGLWLNESFATQMAAIAEVDVTEFRDTWHGFFTGTKKDAYRRDSRVTTHPIEMPINSTDEFFSVFDDITYDKGSSVLKQLEHLVGNENYRRGVSAYLKENAYGTTELADFIGHQEKSSSMDLGEWSDEWLYKAGFDTLGIETTCDGATLRSLVVTQTAPPAHPYPRTHLVDVALYNADKNETLARGSIFPVRISGARTVVEIPAALPCPVLINPNHDDWTYAKIQLEDAAAGILGTHLHEVPDPLARSMFLSALFDRATAGDMPIAEYVERALRLANTEQNIRVIQQISTSIVESIDLMRRLRPETDDALAILIPDIEMQSLKRAHFAETQDLKRIWLNTFMGTVSTPAGLGTARGLLDGKAEIAGIDMSSDIRWSLLTILSRNGEADIDDRLDAESERDPSDSGVKSLLLARAAKPDKAVKAMLLDELENPKDLTGLAQQRAVMAGLFPSNQTDLQLELLGGILDALPKLSGKADPYFMSSYVSMLLKPMCQKDSSSMMQSVLDEYGDELDTTALRFLREALQADEECLALRGKQ